MCALGGTSSCSIATRFLDEKNSSPLNIKGKSPSEVTMICSKVSQSATKTPSNACECFTGAMYSKASPVMQQAIALNSASS